MILGLEARMHILESAWSVWMQTYQFLAYQTDKLHSQKSLVLASIQWKLCLPGIWAAEICLLLWIQNSHIFLAISLLESDFMLPCLFIYVTAVVLPEKILTCFLLGSFWKALVLIQLLVIPKHLSCNITFHWVEFQRRIFEFLHLKWLFHL